jgi:hypothetical protein
MNPQILLFIIKIILGGITAFLAILIMSKTRAASWMCVIAGILISYVALIFDLFETGIFNISVMIFGIPLITLIFTVLTSLCFIAAFIFKLLKK